MNKNNVKRICISYDVIENIAIEIAKKKLGIGAGFGFKSSVVEEEYITICLKSDYKSDVNYYAVATYEELAEAYAKSGAKVRISCEIKEEVKDE